MTEIALVVDRVLKLMIYSMIQTQKGSNERLFNTDTQYANFQGNPLYQATKRHLNR